MENIASASVHRLYTRNQNALWVKMCEQNSDSTTKWLTPNIVYYIVDREQFRTAIVYTVIEDIQCECGQPRHHFQKSQFSSVENAGVV